MYRASPPCIAVAVAIESGVNFFDTSDVYGAAGSAPTTRATAVALSADDVAVLGEVFSPDRVRGGQYGELGVRNR
jgi:aryl-alcohol dehydrogenase-like predicted oxidoreductase